MGIALAQVVADKTGLQMRAQPIGGTSQLMPQIERGEIEFGMFSAIDMTDGYAGKGSYPGKLVQNLRTVAVLNPIYYLATFAGADPRAVEKVVAALHDSRDALIAAFPGYRDFGPDKVAKVSGAYHPDAIKAYSAKGVWPPNWAR